MKSLSHSTSLLKFGVVMLPDWSTRIATSAGRKQAGETKRVSIGWPVRFFDCLEPGSWHASGDKNNLKGQREGGGGGGIKISPSLRFYQRQD